MAGVEITALDTATADALVLNGLAAAAPDEKIVPAFDAQRVRWDIDVETYSSHPRVRYYLGYFDGIARTTMEIFLQRGARYEQLIRRRFEAEGLPGDLGYLALIESGYSNEAVSRSYAVGMWQFMRGTGRGYGLRVDSWVDERRDPVKATDAAARHLRDLRDRFGSLYLAAAAYNAGAGKVSRSLGKLQWDAPSEALTEAAVADSLAVEEDSTLAMADTVDDTAADAASDAAFFRLASADLLAAETQDYVPKLIASALIAKAPERYGFVAPSAEPFAYDSIVVTDVTGLDVIAKLAEHRPPGDSRPQSPVSPARHAAALDVGHPAAAGHRGDRGGAVRRAASDAAGPIHHLPGPSSRTAHRRRGTLSPAGRRCSGGQSAAQDLPAPGRHGARHPRGRGTFGARHAGHRGGGLLAPVPCPQGQGPPGEARRDVERDRPALPRVDASAEQGQCAPQS